MRLLQEELFEDREWLQGLAAAAAATPRAGPPRAGPWVRLGGRRRNAGGGNTAAKAQCTYSLLDASSWKSWGAGGDRGRMAKRNRTLSWHCPVYRAAPPPCLASLGLGWEDFHRLPLAQHGLAGEQEGSTHRPGALAQQRTSPSLSQCSWWVVVASPFYRLGNRGFHEVQRAVRVGHQ